MKLNARHDDFIAIGENIHATRIVTHTGKHIGTAPDGSESIRFTNENNEERFLPIPDNIKNTREYLEGRVKHIKVAIQAAMLESSGHAGPAIEYLKLQIQRQVNAGADYLDLNVDEYSQDASEQRDAIKWLVSFVQEISTVPLCVDSSNFATLETGLRAIDDRGGKPLLNSASLERLSALDLAVDFNCPLIVTAAGENGMPSGSMERVENASRIVEEATTRGIELPLIYIDPLMFPISVDTNSCNHVLDAIRELRQIYGGEIHITGGFSNVSFGLPCRRLVNEVFAALAIEAGADSGIIDPIANDFQRVFSLDTASPAYRITEAMLLGQDPFCGAFLAAYRSDEFADY